VTEVIQLAPQIRFNVHKHIT